MRFLRSSSLLLVMILSSGIGCASFDSLGAAGNASKTDATRRMDQSRLEEIFSDQVEAITGPTGAIQSQIEGFSVYCISDPANDEMRLLAPITRLTGVDARLTELLLRANFDNTGDARYAISEGVVFATFLHPISSLTDGEIRSALSQVVSLAKTFGTTFSGDEWTLPEAVGAGGMNDSGIESTKDSSGA